ncbi:MAG TPA: GNAT family N-acetyltransferase [Pyrinomonadaceae bacterium]|nr:GNAT family N-acetyltransferase [Pyrinomonadaceae bacterium]
MSEFVVRKMIPEDIPSVIEIADATGLCPWSEAGFHAHLADPACLGLTMVGGDNLPAGFLVARRVPGRENRPDAELLNIAVIKEVQGQGLATLLMKPFLDWCQTAQVERIWLEVRGSNHSAIKFYSKNGFFKRAILANNYVDPVEPGLLMVRYSKDYWDKKANA